MNKFLTCAAAIAVLLTIAHPVLASVPSTGLAGSPIVVASEDIPVWGPLRGHANPKCPPYAVCPKPTIYY